MPVLAGKDLSDPDKGVSASVVAIVRSRILRSICKEGDIEALILECEICFMVQDANRLVQVVHRLGNELHYGIIDTEGLYQLTRARRKEEAIEWRIPTLNNL